MSQNVWSARLERQQAQVQTRLFDGWQALPLASEIAARLEVRLASMNKALPGQVLTQ